MVSELKGLRIVGYKGQLTIVGDPKAERVRFKALAKDAVSSSWTPQVTVVDGWLEIRVAGPASKQDWRSAQMPRQDFEIRSQPLPLVVVWGEGDISLKSWTQTVALSHQNGKVKIEDGKELLKLNVHDGDVDVLRHEGRIEVDSYLARIQLKKIVGSMKVENFDGRLNLTEGQGDLNLKSMSGKNFIDGLKGNLEFDNQKGEINFGLSEGSVQGKSAGGSIEGRLRGPVEVRLRSDDARVTLSLQKGLGARVDYATQKGQISTTLPLKVERQESFKIMKGQLPGSQVSSVFVRSQTGDLKLRSL